MAIWGTSKPEIYDIAGAKAVDLDYSLIQANRPDYDRLEQKNPISRNAQYVCNGYWWTFEVLVHIYKWDDVTTGLAYSKYIELANLLFQSVYIKPYSDHDYLQNASGDVAFTMTELKVIELTTINYETALILKFESQDYVDASLSAAA